jgi:competence protein ComEC
VAAICASGGAGGGELGAIGDQTKIDDAPQRMLREPSAFARVRPEADQAGKAEKPSHFAQMGGRLRRLPARLRRSLDAAVEEEEAFGHFFLLYPVFMIAGTVWWFTSHTDPPLTRLIAWAALLLPLLFVTRHSRKATRVPVQLCAFFLAGAVTAFLQTALSATVIMDSPVSTTVTARVLAVEMREAGRWRYTVTILDTEKPRLKRPPTTALLGMRGQDTAFAPGTVVKGLARLQSPAGPALPGLNDFAFNSYFKGIGAIGGFMGKPKPVAAQSNADSRVAQLFADRLAAVRSAINQRMLSVLPGDTGAFASALVTNDTAAFSKQGLEALRISGLAHVISISGLHMVLAAGISFVGIRLIFSLFPGFIQRRPAKTYAAFGAILTSGLYLLISGMPVSAVRSFIMLAVMMGGVVVARTVLTLRSVALAAFAILLVSPSSVLGPSFQMSFGAAAALVSGYSLWRLKPLEFKRFSGLPHYKVVLPAIRAVGGVMLTSEIAGFATAIFSVTHFHRLTLLGTLGNVAAMPFISFVVMPSGFLSVLLMPFGLDYFPLRIMGLGLDATLVVARSVSSLGGDIVTGQMAAWVLPAACIAFVSAILPRSSFFRFSGAATFLCVLAAVAAFGVKPRPDMVVSETADLVGILDHQGVTTNMGRPPTFIEEQWVRALAVDSLTPPAIEKPLRLERTGKRKPLTDRDEWQTEDAMEAAGKAVEPGRFLCSGRDWCIGKLANGLLVATFSDFAFQGPACRQARIAIAGAYLREPHCEPGEAQLFDRNALRQRGSLAIYVTDSTQTEASGNIARNDTAFRVVGALDGLDRPWLNHRIYDWRSNSYRRAVALNDSGE